MMGHSQSPSSRICFMFLEPLGLEGGDMTPGNIGAWASEGSHPALWGSVSPSVKWG